MSNIPPMPIALMLYSEWLDADQGLMVCDPDDRRTHDDLVNEFLATR
jgi:hypothetical protein